MPSKFTLAIKELTRPATRAANRVLKNSRALRDRVLQTRATKRAASEPLDPTTLTGDQVKAMLDAGQPLPPPPGLCAPSRPQVNTSGESIFPLGDFEQTVISSSSKESVFAVPAYPQVLGASKQAGGDADERPIVPLFPRRARAGSMSTIASFATSVSAATFLSSIFGTRRVNDGGSMTSLDDKDDGDLAHPDGVAEAAPMDIDVDHIRGTKRSHETSRATDGDEDQADSESELPTAKIARVATPATKVHGVRRRGIRPLRKAPSVPIIIIDPEPPSTTPSSRKRRASWNGEKANTSDERAFVKRLKIDTPSVISTPVTSAKPRMSLDDFSVIKKIGVGGFGVVALAKHKQTDVLYAIKAVHRDSIKTQKQLDDTLGEQIIMYNLSMEDMAPTPPLFGSFFDSKNLYMAMPYYRGQTLDDRICAGFGLADPNADTDEKWAIVNDYIGQIIHVVLELHKRGYVHRDLKPSNLLIDDNGKIVLGDVGLAQQFDVDDDEFDEEMDGMTGRSGTPAYMGPEMIYAKKYSSRVDWFAVGAIVVEMVTGKKAFKAAKPEGFPAVRWWQTDKTWLKFVEDKRYPRLNDCGDFSDLVADLLAYDPADRVTGESLKEHDHFRHFDWDACVNGTPACRWIPLPLDPDYKHPKLSEAEQAAVWCIKEAKKKRPTPVNPALAETELKNAQDISAGALLSQPNVNDKEEAAGAVQGSAQPDVKDEGKDSEKALNLALAAVKKESPAIPTPNVPHGHVVKPNASARGEPAASVEEKRGFPDSAFGSFYFDSTDAMDIDYDEEEEAGEEEESIANDDAGDAPLDPPPLSA